MGTIIEINDNVVIVKFDDGHIRKYLKENFIMEPELNKNIQLNNDGTISIIDIKNRNIFKLMIALVGSIIFLLIIIFGIYNFISCAIDTGNEMSSCISTCPD